MPLSETLKVESILNNHGLFELSSSNFISQRQKCSASYLKVVPEALAMIAIFYDSFLFEEWFVINIQVSSVIGSNGNFIIPVEPWCFHAKRSSVALSNPGSTRSRRSAEIPPSSSLPPSLSSPIDFCYAALSLLS